ncbi:MAG TPA: DUF485 domain-containing protein [Terriglobales bacterium]|nr:DUF485 domain-containing protein [Terriglobales bacterium]
MSHEADSQSGTPLSGTNHAAIASSKSFRDLLAIKKTFIIPAFLIFLVHYFALALLIGYAPKLASTRVIGTVTVAYLFALSQFLVGWIIAALYILAASRFDTLAADILAPTGVPQHNAPRGAD